MFVVTKVNKLTGHFCVAIDVQRFSNILFQLWNTFHEPHQVERACRQSLDNLQLDYIDLYLIHFPFGYEYTNDHEQWPRNPDGSRALRYINTSSSQINSICPIEMFISNKFFVELQQCRLH